MKRNLILAAIIPLLIGAKYAEPSSNFATIEFTQTGEPQATFHRNGKDCSGMERLPGQPFYFNASVGSLKFPAGEPIAFKLFQFKGMGPAGPGFIAVKGCHVATSFTPVVGASYHIRLDGLACRVDVFAKNPADNTEAPEESARARSVKPPFSSSGPFCKDDV
jgi:hypothetical protein